MAANGSCCDGLRQIMNFAQTYPDHLLNKQVRPFTTQTVQSQPKFYAGGFVVLSRIAILGFPNGLNIYTQRDHYASPRIIRKVLGLAQYIKHHIPYYLSKNKKPKKNKGKEGKKTTNEYAKSYSRASVCSLLTVVEAQIHH